MLRDNSYSVTKNTDFSRQWYLEINENSVGDYTVRISTFEDDFIADSKIKIEYYTTKTIGPEYNLDKTILEFLKRNSDEIEAPEDWRVRTCDSNGDSVIKQFVGVPLPYFWKLWRTPLIPMHIMFDPIVNETNMLRFSYMDTRLRFSYMDTIVPRDMMYMAFDVFMQWPGLIADINKHKSYVLQTVLPWIHKHCKGRLYLFSDYESIFESSEDEVMYLADIG